MRKKITDVILWLLVGCAFFSVPFCAVTLHSRFGTPMRPTDPVHEAEVGWPKRLLRGNVGEENSAQVSHLISGVALPEKNQAPFVQFKIRDGFDYGFLNEWQKLSSEEKVPYRGVVGIRSIYKKSGAYFILDRIAGWAELILPETVVRE